MNKPKKDKTFNKREPRIIYYSMPGRPPVHIRYPVKNPSAESNISTALYILNITKCHGDNEPLHFFPIAMDIKCYFTPPKMKCMKDRLKYNDTLHTAPVHVDSLIKSILDLFHQAECAASSNLILPDVGLVAKINVEKFWNFDERTDITIEEINE